MPEKKQGMLSIIKSVFKVKKTFNEDIVCQAEKVISQYIYARKNQVMEGYRKKTRLLSFFAWSLIGLISLCVYNLVF